MAIWHSYVNTIVLYKIQPYPEMQFCNFLQFPKLFHQAAKTASHAIEQST